MMPRAGYLLLLLGLVSLTHSQYDFYEWPNRSTVVHLFEWRWQDVARECEDFLAPNNYAGIQLSPVAEHLVCTERPADGRPWWEVYQPFSYNIGTRSGTLADFTDMVARCNAVGIRVMIDVVLNHMSGDWTNPVGTLGTPANPQTRDYPGVPYNAAHFNELCAANDYRNATEVRVCEISNLHDLNTNVTYVRDMQVLYLNSLINLGVVGFRVDAAKHIYPDHLNEIFSRLDDLNEAHGFPPGARAYVAQEVIDFDTGEAVRKMEYYLNGYITEFRYGYEIGRAMRGQNPLKYYYNFGVEWGLAPTERALVFNDNHDNQRGHGVGGQYVVTFKDPRMKVQAEAYMHAWPHGFPRIISSFDFTNPEAGPPMDANEDIMPVIINPDGTCGNGWVCEHRWPGIRNMIDFRIAVEGTNVTNWWDNGNNMVAWCREDKGFFVINGEAGDLSQTLMTCLPAGTYCDVISGKLDNGACTGISVTVAADSTALISIPGTAPDGAIALHVNARLP